MEEINDMAVNWTTREVAKEFDVSRMAAENLFKRVGIKKKYVRRWDND